MTLAEMLQTEDPAEQEQIVAKLLEAVQAPIVVLTAIADSRSGKIDITLNGTYAYEEIYALLDLVRREVTRREREALLQQDKKE
jgi:hypothetical protein